MLYPGAWEHICTYRCLEMEAKFLKVTRVSCSAPAQLRPPLVEGINSTTMHLRWLAPEEQEWGPSPVYQLERREPSLPAPRATVMKGARFTGHGYYKFPNSTHPVNTDFTGKCAWCHFPYEALKPQSVFYYSNIPLQWVFTMPVYRDANIVFLYFSLIVLRYF